MEGFSLPFLLLSLFFPPSITPSPGHVAASQWLVLIGDRKGKKTDGCSSCFLFFCVAGCQCLCLNFSVYIYTVYISKDMDPWRGTWRVLEGEMGPPGGGSETLIWLLIWSPMDPDVSPGDVSVFLMREAHLLRQGVIEKIEVGVMS